MSNKIIELTNKAKPATNTAIDPNYSEKRWEDKRVGDYGLRNGVIYYMREGRDTVKDDKTGEQVKKKIPTDLTINFAARVVEELITDDGADEIISFVIEGRQTNGRALPTLTLSASQYQQMLWLMRSWGTKALIDANQAAPRRLALAIILLSGDIPLKTTYGHMGFRRIDGKRYYLSTAGALSEEGINEAISVDLGIKSLNNYALPAPTQNPRQRAGHLIDLRTMSKRNPAIGTVLMCAAIRAVLNEIKQADFAVMLVGSTGTRKSSMAAIAQAAFGRQFDKDNLPGNFLSSEGYQELVCFRAKDALIVFDDFKPGTNKRDSEHNQKLIDRLVTSAGNSSARGKLHHDSTAKNPKEPRGLAVITAEHLPKGGSILGRSIIVEVGSDDADLKRLSELQSIARAGIYSEAMAGFIQWLLPRLDDLRSSFPQSVIAYREKAHQDKFLEGTHSRAGEIYANLMAAANLYLQYCESVGALTMILDPLEVDIDETLKAIIANQRQYQTQSDEVERFKDLLRGALAGGDAHVIAIKGPPAPEQYAFALGWRNTSIFQTGKDQDTPDTENKTDPLDLLQPCGSLIGFVNLGDRKILLEPEPMMKVIQRLATTQGEPLVINRLSLLKRLMDKGVIEGHVSKKDGAKSPTKKASTDIQGRRPYVIELDLDIILRQNEKEDV